MVFIMKKIKIIAICLLSCCLLMIIILLIYSKINQKSELYKKYQYPNEDYYGKELYSEIDYECSDYERKIGEMIVDRAMKTANYTGTEQDAKMEIGDVGALSRYYYFETKDVQSQEADFQFITCKITGNAGRVWVETTIKRYDENGNMLQGEREMLSLWYIVDQDNYEWNVVAVFDTPCN